MQSRLEQQLKKNARRNTFFQKVKDRILQIRQWFLSNIVLGVTGALVFFWMTISYIVYQIESGVEGANITTYGKSVWWGVVTFLTVGYGDFTPITPWGRFWGSTLMIVGVAGVAIITSKISSFFLEQFLREGRGLVDRSRLKDHFIVCGWKEDMHQLLTHILDFNPNLESSQLVMVANIDQQKIDAIIESPRLKKMQFIIGNPYEAVILERAAPERAKKVLILADRTPKPDSTLPTMTEVDARTIMIAMTLANVARGTLVTAEILDPLMDHYLKLASVGEIIYSREYSRLLLGNAAGGTGIANVIFDLLNPSTPALIKTRPISEAYFGKKFGEYKAFHNQSEERSILLGVLENTGNVHWIKEQALKQAQKTPDMHRLLENLKSIKQIQCNHPIISPKNDHVIREGSMAIVIEVRADVEGVA